MSYVNITVRRTDVQAISAVYSQAIGGPSKPLCPVCRHWTRILLMPSMRYNAIPTIPLALRRFTRVLELLGSKYVKR